MAAPGLLIIPLLLVGGVALYFWVFFRVFGRSRKTIVCSVLLFLLAAFFGPLLSGVWVPDAFSGRVHLLASTKLADGTDFRVTQYWDGGPDYMTELWVTFPDGHRESQTLDGDDNKSWHIPISVDSVSRTVTVVLSGDRKKTVTW